MEDIAKYAERLIVVNDGEIAYDDAPKAVFAHYRELEAWDLQHRRLLISCMR